MIADPCVHTFLHPGDVVCAHRGDRLETLLGSCVAILLTDPHRTVGAMCHIVHANKATTTARQSTCHASTALATLYRLITNEGLAPRLCKAYVYGGGNMFPALPLSRQQQSHVGDANARWVLQALQHDGVEVIHHDLGGFTYRRVAWTIGAQAPKVEAVKVA
ncbi:MAG: chemotaxis protein CheD [Aquabacterium sp.]|uniref:chemotaxis protein CheD n=1 Tax=Aquabacterium sp. TaxID=1872578 RepID=UPI002715F54E|nr:chemotaxis protein CheD [Aquabacterium sp.]MDO9004751.1 chemotaxis protein CheD [Aquabacterium sp.]